MRKNAELYRKILEEVESHGGSTSFRVDPDDCPGYSQEDIDAHVEMLIQERMVVDSGTVGPFVRGLTTAGRRRLDELGALRQ